MWAMDHNPSGGMQMELSPHDLLTRDITLPSPPDIYFRLTRVLEDPKSDMEDFARLIENDPGIVARVLRLANSAFYGFTAKVTTIRRAVTLIGTRELRDLVLATTVMEMFNGLPNEIMNMRTFWHQSLRAAVIAKVFAACHHGEDELEPIFICGLLHQIGNLVIYHKLPELAREALLRHQYQGIPLHEAERQVMGLNHADVGGEMMRLWNMPPLLIETLSKHTCPEQAEIYRTETALVHLAARIMELETFEPETVLEALPPGHEAWKAAGLREDAIAPGLVEAETLYHEVLKLF